MKMRTRLLSAALTVMLPFVLLLGSIRLVMTEAYLTLEYNKPDFPPDSFGFSLEDRLRYAPIAVQYLLNNELSSWLNQIPKADGSPLYTDRELKHMEDVKLVVTWAMIALAAISALSALIIVILARSRDGRVALRRALTRGGTGLIIALISLVIYILLDWDHFFDGFHNLFFAPGSWQFFADDSLIRLFPIRFWQDTAITVGVLSGLSALVIIGGCLIWSRRVSRSVAESSV